MANYRTCDAGALGYGLPHGERPRHPSQLYELGLRGLFIYRGVALCVKPRLPGQVSGFLVGYALSRLFVEFFVNRTRNWGI